MSIVEAKLDRIGLKGEERESMKETYLSWFKALGRSEKANGNDAILADLLGAEGDKQDRLALKYHFAEQVLVWRAHDQNLTYFTAPTEPDPLFKKLIKTQIEETIRVLEFAERGKLFIGYPNECDVKTELIEMRERFKALQKGPLK